MIPFSLQAADTWQSIQEVVETSLPLFNDVNTATAIQRTVRVTTCPREDIPEEVKQMARALMQHYTKFIHRTRDPRALSGVVYGLTKLDIDPGGLLVDAANR